MAFILSNFIFIIINLLLIYTYSSDTSTVSPAIFTLSLSFSHSLPLSFVLLKKMGSLETERKTTGWAARDPSGVLSPYTYTLR
jgi:hypothetical protein